MSRTVITDDIQRKKYMHLEDKHRPTLYSWVNADGSGKPSGKRTLMQLAMFLHCSMYEARLYALLAGNHSVMDDPVIITVHGWDDKGRPYKSNVEPIDRILSFRIFNSYTYDEAIEKRNGEIAQMCAYRGRIKSMEKILGYL